MHIMRNNRSFPCVYAVMAHKSYASYSAVLQCLSQRAAAAYFPDDPRPIKWESTLADFETGSASCDQRLLLFVTTSNCCQRVSFSSYSFKICQVTLPFDRTRIIRKVSSCSLTETLKYCRIRCIWFVSHNSISTRGRSVVSHNMHCEDLWSCLVYV